MAAAGYFPVGCCSFYPRRSSCSGISPQESGQEEQISCQGLFVSIGRLPNSSLVQDQLILDSGYIPTDALTRTQIPGVFAVGDVRTTALRQVVTAVADGALAIHGVENYLDQQNN